jgi:hypothetical protein
MAKELYLSSSDKSISTVWDMAINPRHLVELVEGVMAPDPERLALNLEIPAILQRSLAKIAERREFTLAVRA